MGAILTRSRFLLSAILRASAADMMPSCSPSSEITLISLSRISSLICCSCLLMLKHLLLKNKRKARAGKPRPRIKSTLFTGTIHPFKDKLLTDAGVARKVRAKPALLYCASYFNTYSEKCQAFFQNYFILLRIIAPADIARPAPINNAAVRPLNNAPIEVQ